MPLLNKFFRKKSFAKDKKAESEIKSAALSAKEIKVQNKLAGFKPGKIILGPVDTEKASLAQKLNQYIFKVAAKANKIEIAKAVGKNYNVKVASVNIINIQGKVRRVGKTKGFKSGYKKAVVALAEGQSIEIK